MKEMGIDISTHRSCDIASLNLAEFDVVLAMTRSVAQRLREAGVEAAKIKQMNVSDPYRKGIDVYRSTAKEIESQLRSLFGILDGGFSLK
jgi:protein-tyrosine-phosphatase